MSTEARGHRAQPPTEAPVLRVRDVAKRFGAVDALRGVTFELRPSEILALLGDNGAGKSTLIKCISGVHRPDAGTIELDGHRETPSSPAHARSLGIETVYQDLALFDNLGAPANFFAGREISGPNWMPRGLRIVRDREMRRETENLLTRLEVNVPGRGTGVGLMSGGQRQAVALCRAVAFASKLVMLDEPTAALGVRETRNVLELVRRLKEQGKAVILISHNLEDVAAVADRCIILRRGRLVGEEIPSPTTHERIVSLIVGGTQGEDTEGGGHPPPRANDSDPVTGSKPPIGPG